MDKSIHYLQNLASKSFNGFNGDHQGLSDEIWLFDQEGKRSIKYGPHESYSKISKVGQQLLLELQNNKTIIKFDKVLFSLPRKCSFEDTHCHLCVK